ncbi:MAG: hypothetical protein ABW221_15135 [Vicinamibacteria bacterium]
MADRLARLAAALPRMEAWIRALHATHAPRAQPASCLGFERLAEVWPRALLDEACAVAVERVPYPPVSELGLPELEEMAQARWSGITFGHMYFVDADDPSEATHFHELCHVVQWKALGVRDFLMTYALGLLAHGYRQSPLEAIAYELQRDFEAGITRPALVEAVTRHALDVRRASLPSR